MNRAVIAFLIAAWLLGAGVSAAADDVDQNEARRAVERGELRPFKEILTSIDQEFGGKVLEVELEREDSGRLIYEIEILTRDGRVLELEYDGRTGRRISLEEDDD